jgi:hypothetical protein
MRYRDFVRRLPGLRVADIDAALAGSTPSTAEVRDIADLVVVRP